MAQEQLRTLWCLPSRRPSMRLGRRVTRRWSREQDGGLGKPYQPGGAVCIGMSTQRGKGSLQWWRDKKQDGDNSCKLGKEFRGKKRILAEIKELCGSKGRMGSVQRAAASAGETEGYLSAGRSWCVSWEGIGGLVQRTEGSGGKREGLCMPERSVHGQGDLYWGPSSAQRGRMPSKFEGLTGTPYLHGDDTQLLRR